MLALYKANVGDAHSTLDMFSLNRGLAFTFHALHNVQSDTSADLHVCFKRSYDTVLRHHHTFVIRSVVYVCLSVLVFVPISYSFFVLGRTPHRPSPRRLLCADCPRGFPREAGRRTCPVAGRTGARRSEDDRVFGGRGMGKGLRWPVCAILQVYRPGSH